MKEHHFGPVWFIPGDNRGRYPCCHSIYIESAGVLIDPASNRERLSRLRDNEGVNAVWLSHWHEDHATHLDLFHDVPLLISQADASPLSDIELMLNWYGIENDDERHYWLHVLKNDFNFKPRKPSGFLHEGIIDLKGVTVDVLSTPGHTPGHLAFFFQEPGVLFMGDYDLTSFGPWYGDRDSSIENTIASINRLKNMPAKIWLTGHDRGFFETSPDSLWDRYEGVIYEREGKLLDALKTPRTMEEITHLWIIYGKSREPKAFFEFGERVLIKKHLQLLMKKGMVIQEGSQFFRV